MRIGVELYRAEPEKEGIMPRLLTLLCAAATLIGCSATHQGYLLKTDTGQRSTVIFHDNPTGKHGSVEAVLANGERCQGQFNTVPDQVTPFGSLRPARSSYYRGGPTACPCSRREREQSLSTR